MDPESPLFTEVILARAASCDACTTAIARGERAHLVAGARARVRCASCLEKGLAPLPEALPPADEVTPRASSAVPAIAAAIVPLSATSMATPLNARAILESLAVLGAASLVKFLRSKAARRFSVTLAVALKSASAIAWAKMRGKQNPAPAIMRRAFEELGPTYIKLGQLVASSQGLFPEAYCTEFRGCLDRVKPFAYEDVERTLREELGRDPSEIFASIDQAPLASASIAQVHAARLKDGGDVVIKVQRPGIGETIAQDLRILRGFAQIVARVPNGDLANPVDIVDDFEANLHEELDFVHEAENMDEFNRIMVAHHQTEVAAPRVVHALTTKRILVMERFYGHRVDDVERMRAKDIDGEEKLLLGMRAWFQCMIHHGFFHGDVHAGNLMALDDGRIGFLDFGIVGRFAPERRAQVTDYLMSFASGDFMKLARTMVAMGSVDGNTVDLEALARDLRADYEPMLKNVNEAVKYADMIPAVMRTSLKHRMRMPRDFVLITKQMLYFDRYAKVLAPKLNIFRDPRVVTSLAMDVMMAQMQMGMPALA